MWIIESKVLGSKYYLLPERSYVVGRKDCDVLILGDPAISRRHATFNTSTQVQNPNVPIPRTTLHLEDQSKFGTYVNNDKMTNGQKIQLKEGDIITFGTDKSSFTLSHEDLVVTTSCLDNTMKKSVKFLIKKIGGCLVSEWNKYCDLAIMSNLSVTIKVISALIMNKPVVTPEYLVQLHKSLENHGQRPDPKLFLPSLDESQLDPEDVSFTENPGRRQLFHGMKFIFLTSKQHQKLHMAVELGGGATVLMENGGDADEATVIKEKSVVLFSDQGESQISQLTQTTQQWVNKVLNLLKQNKKRAIPEAELGYAVLYCSTDKYCNPDVIPQDDHFPTVAASVPEHSVSQSAPNTVNQQASRGIKVWGGPSGETARSTLLETESRSQNSDVKDIHSRKRVRDTSETSPSLPAPKLPKQATSPIATVSVKRTTSPVPMTTREESAIATEATVKQELMSQSVDLFPTNPNTMKTSRMGSGDIFGEETDFTAMEKSDVDDIFASPVIRPIKGPTLHGDDEFDTVPGSSRRRRQDTKLNTTRSDTQSNQEISTQNRRQRADSSGVDEFDAVTSSRKRRRQTQTQLTQVKMKVIEPELLLLDTDTPTQAPQVKEKKPSVAKIDEGEFIQAKHAPEKLKVKQETDHALDSDSEKEEAKNCCNVKTANLLRRKPKKTAQDGEFNMWKGKRVKNFKKFRKTGTHQSQGDEDVVRLPRIIGGRDLLPHKTLKQKSIMQKFAKELEEQSSQQESFDRGVTEMFDAVPTKKVVGRKARK